MTAILSPAHASATSSTSCTYTPATSWLQSFHRIRVTIPFPLTHMWDSWRCIVQLQEGCQTTTVIRSSKILLHLVKFFTKGISVLLHCASLHPWACKSSYSRACAQEWSNNLRNCPTDNEMAVTARKIKGNRGYKIRGTVYRPTI